MKTVTASLNAAGGIEYTFGEGLWTAEDVAAVTQGIKNGLTARQVGGNACTKSTPSEDGREAPEVVARLMTWQGGNSYPGNHEWSPCARTYNELPKDHYPDGPWAEGEPLMTVAQHERIVAAKDELISHLRAARDAYGQNAIDLQRIVADKDAAHKVTLDELHALEITVAKIGRELDAQPARQVGGDARECILDLIAKGSRDGTDRNYLMYILDRIHDALYRDEHVPKSAALAPTTELYTHGHPLHAAVFMALSSYQGNDTFEDGVRRLIEELQELRNAPAAVVKKYTWEEIVGLVSEVLGCEYRRDPDFFIGHQMPGINFNSLSRIIDRVQHREVARLNRRAIPVVMPEAIATILPPDPYDDRSGFAVSLVDRIKLEALPSGTKLYAGPLNSKVIPEGLLQRIETLLDLRAEFDPTYPLETHPVNDDAELLIELRALLGKHDSNQG